MARYPSGITGDLPGEDIEDPRARAAQMALEMDTTPIAATAPCMNPECCGPVDFLGNGRPVRYCSTTCRNRASQLRRRALQQLALIERTLAEAKNLPGVPARSSTSAPGSCGGGCSGWRRQTSTTTSSHRPTLPR